MATIREKIAPSWFDAKDDDNTGFLLAPLAPYDAIDFRNSVAKVRGQLIITGEGVRIAGSAVRDWRNVKDAKGEPAPFSRDAYDGLPTKLLEAVASEVFKRTFLSEIERKNSSSPSTSV